MKSLLVALSILSGAAALAAPAAAAERYYAEPATVILIDRGDGYRHDGYRDRERHEGGRHHGRDRWHDRPRYDDRGDRLTERQVAYRLMNRGFVRIEDIDRRRGRYVVRAVRRDGEILRLSVDAYDGGIIRRERIGWTSEGRRGGSRHHRHDGYRRPVSDGFTYSFGGGTIGFYAR